jgi:hypothetical protein
MSSRLKSWVWNHFERGEDANTCTICLKKYSTTTGGSVLGEHLGTHGKFENVSNFTPKMQDAADEALVNWIVVNFLPYSTVDSPFFREFVSIIQPDYTPICRQTLSNRIRTNLPAIKEAIKNELLSVNSKITLTTDTWTSDALQNFVVITAHFMKDWVMYNYTLSFVLLRVAHTGENLRDELLAEIKEWGIEVLIFHSFFIHFSFIFH